MQPPPRLTDLPRYPIAGGVSILAIVTTLAWWAGKDVSPLFATAMIRRGELWRLVTSILPHGGFFHLLFNVYWLWVFGTLLERVLGPIKTAGLIVLFAIASSALEFAFSTGGIGLSGVGYGLFGLLWVLSSRDERFHDAVDKGTIQVFVVWFFVCIGLTLTNVMPVANIAHGSGAVLGILTGFAIARPGRRMLIVAGIGGFLVLSVCAATLWRPALNMSGKAGFEEGRWGYEALVAHQDREAARWFRDAAAYQPKRPEYWLDLGLAYFRLNDKPSAVHAYRKAAELGNEDAQYFLGEMYMSGGAGLPKDAGQTQFWFRKAAAKDNPFVLNNIAWTYATSTDPTIRNPEAALEFARRAVQLTKKDPEPAYLDTLAEAYYANHQNEDAVRTEEQAMALVSPNERNDYQTRLEKYRAAMQGQQR